MRIDIYTIAWNEMRILPYFLDYYAPWVDRIVVFDDGSDDGTRELLAAHTKVELRDFPAKGNSFVMAAREVWEHAWKESRGRADWVIVTNVDEFIWHPHGMHGYLDRCMRRGDTIIHPRGYEMVAPVLPPPGSLLPDVARQGVAMFGYDKRQVFNPDAIVDIHFAAGRHRSNPVGVVADALPVETKLLHYKYVDYDNYHVPRQEALGARLLAEDVAKGLGSQYLWDRGRRRVVYDWLCRHATDVVSH